MGFYMDGFKKIPKMKTGGSVPKYSSGRSVESSDGRPDYGAKTKIGARAAQAVYDKNWANTKMPVDEMFDKTIKARDEADAEVQRETTRGIRPTESKKRGGSVGLYANIHAKRERIKAGSGEKMRSPGTKGAPTKKAFVQSAKTAKK